MNDRVPKRWRLLLSLLRRLPQGGLSRGWGWIADRRLPQRLQRRVNRTFSALMGIDAHEAERPPEAYPSLSEFFVRRLKGGVREWPIHPEVPGSPVDGVVGQCGRLEEGAALQAKGITYPVAGFLAGEGGPGAFVSGYFITIYLSPRHYHRIHAPLDGVLHEARAIPGRLLPVNRAAVRSVPDLFPRNERLVALIRSAGVETALVAVGAYNVGRISADFDPGWNRGRGVTNRRGRSEPEFRRYDPPIALARGQELMAFHLGSTIVLLLDGGRGRLPDLDPSLAEGREIRLGHPLLAGPLTTVPRAEEGREGVS